MKKSTENKRIMEMLLHNNNTRGERGRGRARGIFENNKRKRERERERVIRGMKRITIQPFACEEKEIEKAREESEREKV
jgi:hypothetical protein